MLFLNPIFWITVFVILLPYYKIKNNNIKNALLVIFSISWYIWYTKEVSIYLVSTIVNTWFYGKIFEKNIKSKFMKYFSWIIGIGINLGVLLVLKYNGLMFGRNLGFAVPLGLSFYTFQAIGYCIDIRNGVCRPERNFINHCLFIAFIPQLLTGPISKKEDLGKEIEKEKSFSYEDVVTAIYRITMGLFKKIVIADNIGVIVNSIYSEYNTYSGLLLFIAMILYVIELYADFAGSIDVAIGIARLFGIKLTENFNRPFQEKTVAEFWRKWHITLGVWMREYVFNPMLLLLNRKFSNIIKKRLGKKMARKLITWFSLLVLWSMVGLWHGADIKYWFGNGIWYALLIILGEALEPIFDKICSTLHINRKGKAFRRFQIGRTFIIFCIGSVFFSSKSVGDALNILGRVVFNFTENLRDIAFFTSLFGRDKLRVLIGITMVIVMAGISVFNIDIVKLRGKKTFVRWGTYFILIGVIFLNYILQSGGNGDLANFIYMQF